MTVTVIESFEDFDKITKSGKVVVIDFGATWCGPCRAIAPIYERESTNYGEKIEFYKVDVDSQPEISEQAKIRLLPTFVTFKDGEEIERLTGSKPAELMDMLKRVTSTVEADH